uniref:hypothetical protein n=1 Tax=Prevotella sp. TaxID=59823 RepID=UPI004026DAEA
MKKNQQRISVGLHFLKTRSMATANAKCKILLPKFNTLKQGQIEREKGSLPPFENTVGLFSAIFFCRYGTIALPLQCNGDAIVP